MTKQVPNPPSQVTEEHQDSGDAPPLATSWAVQSYRAGHLLQARSTERREHVS